jgi:HEAT repeat protein
MDVPVKQLVSEYVAVVQVPTAGEEEDVFLQGLVDDFQSSSALFKRDMRRRLEKDPPGFLRAACRILKANSNGPGADYLMELLWSNPMLFGSLIDPRLLSLDAAISFAKRWAAYDPMLDIKLLHMGFPTDGDAVCDIDIVRARRVLALVNELPPSRHILFPLVSLLRSPDAQVRSKAATLYGRTSRNAEWVRSRLGEADARVRANAVESLWGEDSDAAQAVLKEASRDRHHRVAANAWVGLDQMGARDVVVSLKKMAEAEDPMARAAAAFAMGRKGHAEFKPVLEQMLKDSSPHARSQALRALLRMKKQHRRMAGMGDTKPDETQEAEATRKPEEPPEPGAGAGSQPPAKA